LLSPLLVIVSALAGSAYADPDPTTRTTPDPVPRTQQPHSGPDALHPTWDLDGTYLWLAPTGAAVHVDGAWDSLFGADLAVVRVREHATLGTIGGDFGGARYTERDGGRLWLDGLLGTRLGRMVGVSAGATLELADTAHPRFGGSVGVWAFLGVTPYAKVGAAQGLGMFAEIGIHIALPVIRR
jgi:hypothetical protein